MKETRIISVTEHNGTSEHPTPKIMLAGKYLNAYGFNVDDQIELRYLEPGKLSITKVKVSI